MYHQRFKEVIWLFSQLVLRIKLIIQVCHWELLKLVYSLLWQRPRLTVVDACFVLWPSSFQGSLHPMLATGPLLTQPMCLEVIHVPDGQPHRVRDILYGVENRLRGDHSTGTPSRKWHEIYVWGMVSSWIWKVPCVMRERSQIPFVSWMQQSANLSPTRQHADQSGYPDSKVHGANMGPTWVLSVHDGPHVDPVNLAIRVRLKLDSSANVTWDQRWWFQFWCLRADMWQWRITGVILRPVDGRIGQ